MSLQHCFLAAWIHFFHSLVITLLIAFYHFILIYFQSFNIVRVGRHAVCASVCCHIHLFTFVLSCIALHVFTRLHLLSGDIPGEHLNKKNMEE